MFIAVIGGITLTLMALVAIVQVDIKKCLAYSTLSQLGYMIFGMGVGAWIAALFHLMTHAFFKAMLFLCSGQVIEGCHHEQDMRKMGGLMRKMPMTGLTFLIGVLAISGFGIPLAHVGLGGYFSKDEILAVAWDRAYMWEAAIGQHGDEHANAEKPLPYGRGSVRLVADSEHDETVAHAESGATPFVQRSDLPSLPPWLFWCALITAYVTPFYMMRAWWMTFMGRPRDEHVHHHAHERPLMWVPLLVLALFTFVSSYFLFRPLIAHAAPAATDAALVIGLDGVAEEPIDADGHMIHVHEAHHWLAWGVGGAWLVAFLVAIAVYANGLTLPSRLKTIFGPLATLLDKKYYFDEVYDFLLVRGCRMLAFLCRLFDTYIIDLLANLSATITERFAAFSGRGVDANVVDGLFNGVAGTSLDFANVVRSPQTGRIRNYVLFATGGAAIVVLLVLFLVGPMQTLNP